MGFTRKILKCSQPENEKIIEHDWLSNLPSDILYHILSFLSVTEAMKTSLLSRKWRYIPDSAPYLNFDFRDFWNQEHCLALSYDECMIKFWSFVKWAFIIRDYSPIFRLRLHCDYFNAYQLQSLFCLCVVRNVQEVDIFSGYGVLRCPVYSFLHAHVDAFIQNVNSLVKFENSMGFWNLKTLNLVGVHFPDADIAKEVLSDCGVLENLFLERCCFLMIKFLKISAKRLRNLNFVNDGPYWWGHMCMFQGELELRTPNLVSFYYSGPVIRLCQYSDMFFLKNASIKLRNQNNPGGLSVDLGAMVSGIRHVEELSVSPNFVLYFSPEFSRYGRKFSPFDSLRCLKIDMRGIVDHVEGLIKLLQHSPNLEALCIQFIQPSRISHWKSREVDVPCLSHNLKEIEIAVCRDPVNFLELIKFFLQNGKSLEKINITQKEQRLNPEKFYALHEVQLASEAVSVSISSASPSGRKELIKLVYGKCGLSVVTKTGKSNIRIRRSIRIAAKKSARLVERKMRCASMNVGIQTSRKTS
ncbi:F-box/LRR-repeat protein-like protein [Salvia divinorum]|uniref:F-box/LRR-repeat protein-like protein n=1 Tax=Salvia divinorum TaxID=28513 RepID=A0ABD1I1B7_SALDI